MNIEGLNKMRIPRCSHDCAQGYFRNRDDKYHNDFINTFFLPLYEYLEHNQRVYEVSLV